jgi:hypothetical protein
MSEYWNGSKTKGRGQPARTLLRCYAKLAVRTPNIIHRHFFIYVLFETFNLFHEAVKSSDFIASSDIMNALNLENMDGSCCSFI